MPSPLIRKLRMGDLLREVREEAGMTGDQLGKLSGIGRLTISRMETGARKQPDLTFVLKALDTIGVSDDDPRYKAIVRCCRDANERGWWEDKKYDGMGERQRKYADLESGATRMRIYHNALIPGLLQAPEFVAARDDVAAADGLELIPEAVQAGRRRRQDTVIRPDGPELDVLVEEQAIRRRMVGREVLASQLRHTAKLLKTHSQIQFRVVPVDCELTGVQMPLSPFTLFDSDDPEDGTALLVDTVTEDLLARHAQEVNRYVHLFDRLRIAALSKKESVMLLHDTAARLAAEK